MPPLSPLVPTIFVAAKEIIRKAQNNGKNQEKPIENQ
jgi:hypothetical protein